MFVALQKVDPRSQSVCAQRQCAATVQQVGVPASWQVARFSRSRSYNSAWFCAGVAIGIRCRRRPVLRLQADASELEKGNKP